MYDIPNNLGIRYFEILHQDALQNLSSLTDLDKSDTLLKRYIFKFEVYKYNAQIFEKIFTDPNAPLLENSGNYYEFRQQVKEFISVVQGKIDNRTFSQKDSAEVYKAADKLDDIHFKMTGN